MLTFQMSNVLNAYIVKYCMQRGVVSVPAILVKKWHPTLHVSWLPSELFNASLRRPASTLCCFEHEFTLFSVKNNVRFLLVGLNSPNSVKISAVPESDASFSNDKDKIVTDVFINHVRSNSWAMLGSSITGSDLLLRNHHVPSIL